MYVVVDVSKCLGRVLLGASWEGCDFCICCGFVSLELVHPPFQAAVGFWFPWHCFAERSVVLTTDCARHHLLFGVMTIPSTFFWCHLAVIVKKVVNHWLLFAFFRPLTTTCISAMCISTTSFLHLRSHSWLGCPFLKSRLLLCWTMAISNTLTQALSFLPTFWLSTRLPATPDS